MKEGTIINGILLTGAEAFIIPALAVVGCYVVGKAIGGCLVAAKDTFRFYKEKSTK